MNLNTRVKLTLFFSSVSGVVLILSLALLFLKISKNLNNDFEDRMSHDAKLIVEIFKEEIRLNKFDEFQEELKDFDIELQVRDKTNNVILETEGWKDASHFKSNYALYSREVEDESFGIYSLGILRSMDSLTKLKQKLLGWMVGLVPFMIILCAVSGYFFSGKILKPIEAAYEKLKRFTGDASHELRIPLTALRGTLEVALRKERPVAEYMETLENALEETEYLSRLTDELLAIARSDDGKMTLNYKSVQLDEFMNEIFHVSEGLNGFEKIKLELKNKSSGMVVFDPDKIRQLVFNLIENAIKYSHPGGRVQIESAILDKKVFISVIDEGVGVSPADQSKIFERFYRGDKARSRAEGGTGLGLSIASSIAKAHQGTLSVESELGKGSTFTVSLPLKEGKISYA